MGILFIIVSIPGEKHGPVKLRAIPQYCQYRQIELQEEYGWQVLSPPGVFSIHTGLPGTPEQSEPTEHSAVLAVQTL